MMHQLMDERFGVWSSVHDISQLLKNRGFSYQKARFVSDHKDPPTRQEWLTQ
jgi:transposase